MAWYVLGPIVVVLLIGAYAVVRLRRHETDPIDQSPDPPGPG
jgi:hypothetical protein